MSTSFKDPDAPTSEELFETFRSLRKLFDGPGLRIGLLEVELELPAVGPFFLIVTRAFGSGARGDEAISAVFSFF